MAREYKRWVRSNNATVGCVVVKIIDGNFGIGVSICNPKDNFVKKEGYHIANERAFVMAMDCPISYRDFAELSIYPADDFIEGFMPSGKRSWLYDPVNDAISDIVDNVTRDFAKAYADVLANR